jgi:UPF0755 protein
MNFKKIHVLLIIFSLAIITATWLSIEIFFPFPKSNSQSIPFNIEKGESLSKISQNLSQIGVIRNKHLFKWTTILFGKGKLIKIGNYLIQPKISVYQLINLLIRGRTIMLQVTIPEGLRMSEIFELLKRKGYKNNGKYQAVVNDKQFLKSLNVPNNIKMLEGFLFPDTYKISQRASEKIIIKTLVNTFLKRIPIDFAEQAKAANLSYYEAIIMASIIEKETGSADERTIISSVFHNRLRKNMKLQTDPTVIYGIANFDGNLTKRQLREGNPYNTYTNFGLPPTPIANPGLESLLAAVKPAKTKYLYFVAKGNGKHKFSVNYRSHVNAVRKYQKRRKKDYRSF